MKISPEIFLWLIPCAMLRNKDVNEVLLCLQEELEGMGSSLELFGFPSPNGILCGKGTKNNIKRNVLC